MRLSYTRVLMKHVAIPANSSSMCLDNIFTCVLPDLVVMGFVTDTAFAGSYTENPYNFKNLKSSEWICSVTARGFRSLAKFPTSQRRYKIRRTLRFKSSSVSTKVTVV